MDNLLSDESDFSLIDFGSETGYLADQVRKRYRQMKRIARNEQSDDMDLSDVTDEED